MCNYRKLKENAQQGADSAEISISHKEGGNFSINQNVYNPRPFSSPTMCNVK